MVKKALGKGLGALIINAEQNQPDSGEKVSLLAIGAIEANKEQPRRYFDAEALNELAVSLKEQGMIQPIVVRPITGGKYQIVAGERRFRAAKLAGLNELPAVIRPLSDDETLVLALIENIQREDLNPIEEGQTYLKLLTQLKISQEVLAEKLGKSRPHVANTMRLLALPQEVQTMVLEGKLSAGHGRALLMVPAKQMLPLAKKIVQANLSVREAEKLANEIKSQKAKTNAKQVKPLPDGVLPQVEAELVAKLGSKVQLKGSEAKGQIVIEYYSAEDLDRIIEILLPNSEF